MPNIENEGDIPAQLEDARFRKLVQIIIKTHFYVKGYSLKNKCNDGYMTVIRNLAGQNLTRFDQTTRNANQL